MRSVLILFWALAWTIGYAGSNETNWLVTPVSDYAPHTRIVVVDDPNAVRAFRVNSEKIRPMLALGLTKLTQKPTETEAWRSLVQSQEVIGIKLFSSPGRLVGSRPEVVAAVVQSLKESGFPASRIFLWDKYRADLESAGMVALARELGIEAASSAEEGYDEKVFYENPLLGQLVWGDRDFGSQEADTARKSYVTRLLTRRITKIINIAPLLNHNQAGVSGLLYSLALGSVDNVKRFEGHSGRLATAVPEIMALPEIGDRVVLNIVDALICQYEGEQRSLLHYSTVLNQIRLGLDPVALDLLSAREIQNQRRKSGRPPGRINQELFDNAALLELGVQDERRLLIEHTTP
ncbi:MAG TPA: DUF362 domain-containing protein [Candidatus Paceibacterota bacterium]|nr:DUF362 domain-containing protein [Verrucomicrobiota bacterium]HRY48928.1 DUF362 domain-containing protein [Candidatus Paceibacterota bacterium]HRZ99140.1 DUF362 domain-containing protein [Candidatus Paceibacterota bacterium]